MLEGGKNIRYNAFTTIRVQPKPWHTGGPYHSEYAKVVQRDLNSTITDELTMKWFQHKYDEGLNRGKPRVMINALTLMNTLHTLMIIKKHCV